MEETQYNQTESLELEDIKLVSKVAAHLYSRRIDDSIAFEDYKQLGFIGLLEAKSRYDQKEGASFQTYATYRIRGAILNGITSYSEKLDFYNYKKRQVSERIDSVKENFLKSDSVTDQLNVYSDLIVNLAIGELLENFFESNLQSDSLLESYYSSELSEELAAALGELSEMERQTIISHYFAHLSFSDIANKLGVTKGRVSQLHKSALKKLQQILPSSPDFSVYL